MQTRPLEVPFLYTVKVGRHKDPVLQAQSVLETAYFEIPVVSKDEAPITLRYRNGDDNDLNQCDRRQFAGRFYGSLKSQPEHLIVTMDDFLAELKAALWRRRGPSRYWLREHFPKIEICEAAKRGFLHEKILDRNGLISKMNAGRSPIDCVQILSDDREERLAEAKYGFGAQIIEIDGEAWTWKYGYAPIYVVGVSQDYKEVVVYVAPQTVPPIMSQIPFLATQRAEAIAHGQKLANLHKFKLHIDETNIQVSPAAAIESEQSLLARAILRLAGLRCEMMRDHVCRLPPTAELEVAALEKTAKKNEISDANSILTAANAFVSICKANPTKVWIWDGDPIRWVAPIVEHAQNRKLLRQVEF